MLPELFSIGPFTVYSYGLMLGIAFITANLILNYDYEKRGLDKAYATEVTLIAIIFGIIGSKLLHLIENWHAFIKDPVDMAFSPGGLTFYGGLILAAVAIVVYTQKTKINFFYVADITSPALALAYGIGRIGCHLAGDGDYGIPTSLPWGVNYENGIVKPIDMFAGSDIAAGFPNGLVPNNTPLHPTPIYEFLAAVALFFFLRFLLRKDWKTGQVFGIYLIFSGLFRFLVEFIRLNPRLMLGLSEAQLISVGLMISGGILFLMMKTASSINALQEQYKGVTAKKAKVKKGK
ncbi:MAG: prolipoprotein diacylglyceryl transferase [Ignavibacteriaceae bacterium]|nr:prolipoprotein diacylglyceryl transferase [Ignavibacteriaceae bacterium]